VRALRVVLLLVLLGTLAAVALAQGGTPEAGGHEHEHGHEATGVGGHEHEHGHEATGVGGHEHEHDHEATGVGGHEHEHGHEAPDAGVHEHGHETPEAGGHGHGHVHGEGEDEHTHLPIQMYAIKAYFEAPWRDATQPVRIAWQAGLLALVDAALLAWLWRRWWR